MAPVDLADASEALPACEGAACEGAACAVSTPAEGTCRICVYATDHTGDSQASVSRNRLVVRWI